MSLTKTRSGCVLSVSCAALFVALSSMPCAQWEAAPGFRVRSLALPKPAKGWTGLAWHEKHGLLSFDGKNLVALDPTSGRIQKTLASLPTPVFGSDLAVAPGSSRIAFCESSTGAIYVHDEHGLRRAAKLSGNFALAFNPREGRRFVYATAQPKFTGPLGVFRIDLESGAVDAIAEAQGFGGPIAFDRNGDLVLAPGTNFGSRKQGKLLRWTRAQVLWAIGPRKLFEKQAVVTARGFDGVYDFEFDSEGSLYASDPSNKTSSLLEIPGATFFARDVVRRDKFTLTSLAWRADPRPFERYGRSADKLSGLWIIASDFASGANELLQLQPARPQLSVSDSAPQPGALLRYRASALGAPLAVWLAGIGLEPEAALLPLGRAGLAFPDFGVVLDLPFVAIPLPATNGVSNLQLRAPSVRGFRWTTQVLAGPIPPLKGGVAPSPWVTSTPVPVRTR